jgi:hypothetical protein
MREKRWERLGLKVVRRRTIGKFELFWLERVEKNGRKVST